ncbi:protein odr-4 homolog [Amborella trichopoda]|nr:protein odr-4 homolog [Amborella trichopoda]|eukprot:XP_006856637.2 protein odr-4 homolog [Amborella trichopoda]
MVRTVVGEETHLSSFEAQLSQSGLSAQVGLVIGKITTGSDRGAVYGLVPTPLNDNGEPASLISSGRDDKKRNLKQPKSQQESSSLLIDSDWVAEHARQVSKMLLGGIHVVGVYVWVGESLFKCSSLLLWQTVKAVAAVAPICGGVNLEERILLHMSYSPRRWSCRSCLLGSNFSSTSLRLCDFKLSKIVSGLQTFRCNYSFEIRLPIFAEDMVDSLNFRDVLTRGISCHAQHLKNAKALVDGNLVIYLQ